MSMFVNDNLMMTKEIYTLNLYFVKFGFILMNILLKSNWGCIQTYLSNIVLTEAVAVISTTCYYFVTLTLE